MHQLYTCLPASPSLLHKEILSNPDTNPYDNAYTPQFNHTESDANRKGNSISARSRITDSIPDLTFQQTPPKVRQSTFAPCLRRRTTRLRGRSKLLEVAFILPCRHLKMSPTFPLLRAGFATSSAKTARPALRCFADLRTRAASAC